MRNVKLSIVLSLLVMAVWSGVSLSCSSDEFDLPTEQKTMARRKVTSNEGNDRQVLSYSNCGIWSLAQLLGNANNVSYQNAVLEAAQAAISWDEEKELERWNNNENVTPINSTKILSICAQLRESNSKKTNFERIVNLEKNLPNAAVNDSIGAQTKLRELSSKNKLRGVMIGCIVISKRDTINHWVKAIRLTGDVVEVDDQLAYDFTKPYPYRNSINILQVRAILYRDEE